SSAWGNSSSWSDSRRGGGRSPLSAHPARARIRPERASGPSAHPPEPLLATLLSMPTLRAPRGTHDVLPDEHPAWARMAWVADDLAGRYGYRPMATPIMELVGVFERAIGAATDVVEKELFRIHTRGDARGDEELALRPEATAGLVRAYIEH